MLTDYMGIINLNENEEKIRDLTNKRSLAAVPIGGRYRIIDFVLSNLANAGIRNVGIFTKHKSRSLMDHVNTGKPWDLNRQEGGLFIFNFDVHDPSVEDILMFKNNIGYLLRSKQTHVILTSSYMICNIDYTDVINTHEKNGNDITLVYKNVDNADSSFLNCDSVNIDKHSNILSVGKNIGNKKNINIGLEMFVMSKSTFISLIHLCIFTGAYRKLKHAIYNRLSNYKIGSHEFKGYLSCINSIESYFETNKSFINKEVINELFYNESRIIYTKAKYGAPTKYSKTAIVKNSLIANGTIIEGEVKNSIISRSVIVEKGAIVDNCVINQNCRILAGARLQNVITDKDVLISSGEVLIGSDKSPYVAKKQQIGLP